MEHKRVKHGDLPGDVGKSKKIQMREKPATKRDKSFLRSIIEKGKTVQRRRDKKAIEEDYD